MLIVDDDKRFRKVLHVLFDSGSGFDACVEAQNGVEAIAKAKQLLPNLAILDFSMPEMSGLELARNLKAILPELPIFMLTAEYDPVGSQPSFPSATIWRPSSPTHVLCVESDDTVRKGVETTTPLCFRRFHPIGLAKRLQLRARAINAIRSQRKRRSSFARGYSQIRKASSSYTRVAIF